MNTFDLFNTADGVYVGSKEDNEKETECPSECKVYSCLHLETTFDKDIEICINCGEELNANSQKNDIKYTVNPHNIQIRKSEERAIYKDVESLGFSEQIVFNANDKYIDVTGQQIYRGNMRKAIVFGCVFESFKESSEPQSFEKLIGLFKIPKKIGSKGIKHVNLHSKKKKPTCLSTPITKSTVSTTVITPAVLIKENMKKFNANSEQIQDVISLYERVKNRSSQLNRCRPQSLANSLVYYWIKQTNKNIPIKDFIKVVDLSEMTINKIMKEITTILNK